MATFTDADIQTLLSQPGTLYYRAYGSTGPYTKFALNRALTFTPAVETLEIVFDDAGVVQEQVSKETVEITFETGRVLDFTGIRDLTGGLYTYATIPETLVEDESQEVASGAWSYNKLIMIEHQNHDLSEIVINSVTLGTDGPIVENTDYFKTKTEAGWAIYIKDTATVTTEAQTVTIVYDYTPAAQRKLTRGGKKIIAPIELVIQTVDANDDYVHFYFYKCYSNGADGHGFSPEQSAEPITMSLTFTAKSDTNRADGDNLYKIISGGSSLG